MTGATDPVPRLRRMGSPHLHAVEEIEKASFAAGWPATAFQRELTGNGAARYLVVEEGDVAGFAGLWLMLDEAHVVSVAVLPERRRAGLGRLLIHGLLRVAIEEGMSDATLECRVSNQAARALYRSFGFETAGSSFDLRGVPVPSGPHEALDSGDLYALDLEACGADRSRALNVLMAEPNSQVFTAPGGFLIAQEKVIGPWIARDDHTAATLLNAALAAGKPRERRVMIPAEHTSALNIAQACGFSTLREVLHMRRGKPAPWLRSRIYAHASYAVG